MLCQRPTPSDWSCGKTFHYLLGFCVLEWFWEPRTDGDSGRGAPFLLSLGFLAWKMGMAKQSRSSHCPFHPQVYPLISCLPRKHCVDTERTSRFLQGPGFLETDGLYNK
ncbi:Cgmp-Inhibited 3',5'-Cyclic Phosphodiesterase B [Manis pentadactyla]|nr:Cgmp-Inhibited 3',5'-Cyclic Phosphodiesterase B [Manis pentadactyla]